ncbi:MAG: aryl-sulfate sulfotransferase [Bryobacterales bacterium]|nr:aryl-sulfate sulfotransferase [Bryobacterales bacterium]
MMIITFALLVLGAKPLEALAVSLTPSAPSPGLVGKMVTFSAASDAPSSQRIRYRFRVRRMGRDFRMIRDYGEQSTLDWTASEHEGFYELEAAVKNADTGESAAASILYQMMPRANGTSVVNQTANPLVFLFSAPPCAAGRRMRVDFGTSDGNVTSTPFKKCGGGLSMNFYLAGMKAETTYHAHYFLDTGRAYLTGPGVGFTTGKAPALSYTNTVQTPAPAGASNPVLLTSSGVATDLAGNVLWSMPLVNYFTRAEPGGYFWGILEDDSKPVSAQAIRKFDLVGMTVLETNAERVNEQLQAMGKRLISGFHHEARTLPDGRILALADVEQMETDKQGPGTVDVIGDMIIVFDKDLNVLWTWDAFDWLDVTRPAVLGETCSAKGSGCPPFHQSSSANDWTHGNSVQQTSDGQLLYSSRHQDWVIKLDYDSGNGDGHVIWRLGRDGDFTWNSTDAWPWFSHQHDANFEPANPNRLLVFDDANTRFARTGILMSRGQALDIDEKNRTVNFVLNADLGVFSAAVGSAQLLRDGSYHFDAGYVIQPDNSLAAYSIQVDPTGAITYQMKQNTLIYRSFRMTNLYRPN